MVEGSMTGSCGEVGSGEVRDSSDHALTKLRLLVPKLAESSVRIKNPQQVLGKIQGLIAGKLNHLQVIADFDYTLSRFHFNGNRCVTCYGVVEESDQFTQEYREKLLVLKDKYYPIELCHEMPVEQKIPFMREWYEKGNLLLMEMGLTLGSIRESVKTANVRLRCRTPEMLKILEENSVPLLIFSAGLGDVIEEIMKAHAPLTSNMHIISNRFKFDENGKAVGLTGDLIHMFNKNESTVHHSSYFEDLTHRPNVILMGDSTGDSHMAEGVVDSNVVFKIGFLNTKADERMNLFLDAFDIVLIDDQTMDVPNEILKAISDSVVTSD